MGIKFVLGTAGSGKTFYARHKAAEIVRAGGRAILIVPEQFSFETERAMLDLLPPRLANNVEVFSFTRLANKISHIVGGISGKRLDECGRAAVMNVAIEQVRDYLSLYSADKKGQDNILNMMSAIGEFKSCSITPDMLLEASENTSEPLLSHKLMELSLIYGAYNACVANIGSIDPLDDLTRLSKNLEDIDYFYGSTVIVDSFTGFTNQELAVIEKIINQSESFTITLCCESDNRDNQDNSDNSDIGLFSQVKKTIAALSQFDENIEYEYLNSHPRFVDGALKYAENSVFRFNKNKSFSGKSDNVTIYTASDKYDEVEFTAREIRKLVREQNMRWRDFAIICRTASDYQSQILRALDLQEIPCFCDKRTEITDSPIVRFVLSALDIVNNRWRSGDIFRLIKTGMVSDIGLVQAAQLENYCFIWGINGSKWKQEFTQSPYGYTDKENENDKEILEDINASRTRIVNLIETFEKATKQENVSGTQMAAAVYNLLDSAGAAQCVEKMIPKLPQSEADKQGRVWNSLMNIFDQLANVLADQHISFRSFSELLTLMIGLCDIGQIPQELDSVVFGAADRIRTANPKVVFVLGANDGVFPMTPTSSGLFTENERKKLISMNLPLSGDIEENVLSEQFLAYSAMTCASEKLYVTYSSICNDESLYSSEIVSEILRVLPDCEKLSYNKTVSIDMIENVTAGFLLAADCIHDNTIFSESLAECYRSRDEYADKLDVINSANSKSKLTLYKKSNAYSIFGKNINISASKAECFYSCKFMYFCKYGMKAKPRRRAELNPLEYGNVVHYVLEKLLKNEDVSEFAKDEKLKDKIRHYLEEYLNGVMGGSDMKSSRFLYLFHRLSETLTLLAIQLGNEFSKSLFKPEAFELKIDGSEVQPLVLPLSDGSNISVGGKIDRVDVFDNNGNNYFRVVDYKTGSKEFALSDLLSGLNMQMLIYLDILRENSRKENFKSPAGVIYSPASMGKIYGVRGETSADEKRQDMLKKNGLIIDNSDVVNAMEIGMAIKEDKKSNLGIEGASTFRSSATYIASEKQFEEICQYVRLLLKEMGECLHNGEIEAIPAKGIYDACAYCDYRSICTQEQKNGGREIKKKSMAETMEIIEQSEEGTS